MSERSSIPWYSRSLNFESLWDEFPPAPDYLKNTYLLSADALRQIQEERFLLQMKRAWKIPFYKRHWASVGMQAGDICSLEDLTKIPPFEVADLRDALDRNPPWGDFIGLDPDQDEPMPLVLHTSGGTTGMPRPMLFSPRDREVMNINTGRRLYMQGVRPFDVVQVVLSLGLANGAFLAREGIWKYTGAVPVMTGSGAQTSTKRQIEIMQAWKTKHLIGFPAYLRHIGYVMRDELQLDPHQIGIRGLIVHLGVDDRKALEDLWGAKVYDTYGTNECGSLAAECEYQTGSHVFEDSFFLEIVDPETGKLCSPCERGLIYQTTLFKHLAPLIRFNSNDISAWADGVCACGSKHRRIERIYGRQDNMVKLRGTNIYPEAIGSLIAEQKVCNGEYVCVVESVNEAGRDEMTVFVEVVNELVDKIEFEKTLTIRCKEALGVKLIIRAVDVGNLEHMTGLSSTSKIRRLIDKR
jgi:phenylacetate-CoA ligase